MGKFLSYQTRLFTILGLTLTINLATAQTPVSTAGEKFGVRVVANHLSDPWEIAYGADGQLWVTESKGYRVSRIDPSTGSKTVLLDLNSERQFPRYDLMGKAANGKPWTQGGLMGMAVHPQLLNGKPYVYLMYVYKFEGKDKPGSGCAVNFGGCPFKGRVVRYDYDRQAQKLIKPQILCDTIPQSNDHNGGRLALAPVGGKLYLFYSTGDMGAGQFGNAGQPNHAQNKDSYEGKILRFNAEPDGDIDGGDKWLPNDNPFNARRQNAVWSVGHRNPQGLAYAKINGQDHLYQSEHGPFGDDEVNLISKGKNYGHPLVIGYADGNYNGLAAGVSQNGSLPGRWHTTYPLIGNEQDNSKTIGAAYADPLKSFNPSSNTYLTRLFEARLAGNDHGDWPSEAPSSIAVYTSAAIPGWQNSLLISTLKGNKLIRLKLNKAGDATVGDTICYFKGKVRYRDIALSPDGRKIYLSVDSTQASSNPAKADAANTSKPGSIIEFTYLEPQKGETKGEEDK